MAIVVVIALVVSIASVGASTTIGCVAMVVTTTLSLNAYIAGNYRLE